MYFCTMKCKVTYLLLALLASVSLRAQSITPCPAVTNKGTDFWVMFLYNHNYNSGTHAEYQRVYILGDQSTTVNIANNTSGVITSTLSSPSFFTTQQCGTNQMTVATVYNGGYHITASNDVWVYADDYIDHNQDAALVLPTEALGTHYIVQDYPSNNARGAEVGFVATQDGTILTMTVPCNILGTSITSGATLTINLNAGQTYMLLAVANGSFSGMEVTSNGKPFAMFVAGQNTAVPVTGSGRDYTYEQALPVDLWGTEYIVSSTLEQSFNRLRITSSADNCTVYCNGSLLTSLTTTGQTWEGNIPPSNQWHLTASSPIQVVLYLGSYQSAGNKGDPSSINIPPLNRGVCDTRFISIATSDIPTSGHYINIICHQTYDSGLLLDNQPLPSGGTVAILDNYCCHRVPVSATSNQGIHQLHNDLGSFVAFAYGLGPWESYAYPLGIALDTVPAPSEMLHDTVEYSDTICQGMGYLGYGFNINPINTTGQYDYWRNDTVGAVIHDHHLVLYVFPVIDTLLEVSISQGDTLFFDSDTLTEVGVYLYNYSNSHGCDSTITLILSFKAVHDTLEYRDTVCQNQSYSGYGFEIDVFTTAIPGVVERWRIVDNEDSVHHYHLLLTVVPNSITTLERRIIMGDTLLYNGDTLTERGDYSYLFTAANGCDSTLTLHLEYEEISLMASADGICPGDSVTLNAAGTHAAWWSATPLDTSLAAQQGQTSIVVRPQQTTSYCLFSREGGAMIDCIVVGVEPPPTLCVELSLPFIDFDFPTVYFTDCSEGSVSSTWCFDDGITLNRAYSRRQFHHPLPDSVVVTLQTCNRYHCCADTTFSIPKKIRSVWWPNVFTPDEEQNNRFGCTVTFEIVAFEMHIYNRQGLLVYHTTDPSATWDGTREGEPCPQGAYVYHWHVKDAYGYVKNGTGTVTLIR